MVNFLQKKRSFRRLFLFLIVVCSTAILLLSTGISTLVATTNSTEFCISCHEMESTVYQEYRQSIHYSNPGGVRAECADCHVPKEFGPKMVRKIMAVRDIYHTLIGTMDTPEKFNTHRLAIDERVWEYMENSDSRECCTGHSFNAMDFKHQSKRARKKMMKAKETGKPCIQCHKGIAHHLPEDYDEDA